MDEFKDKWASGEQVLRALRRCVEYCNAHSGYTPPEAIPIPGFTENYTYSGAEITALFTNYDSEKMNVSGTTSAVNAGTYTAVFSLDPGYVWNDKTSEDKEITWAIGKAKDVITASETAVTAETGGAVTVTVSHLGTGTLTAVSGDSDVAAVSLNGGSLVLTAESIGSTTVTISAAGDMNYNAADDVVITVTVESAGVIDYGVYGVSWNGTSATTWTRTDDAASFADPVPYVAGMSEGEYSSPFDNIMPWAGMTVSERTGGTMVAIPKFWYKIGYNSAGAESSADGGFYIKIANEPLSGFSVSPAHMNRGDGKGERDVVYVGRYHGADNSNAQRRCFSTTGAMPISNYVRSSLRRMTHEKGETLWQIDFATLFTLWLLYLVEFANWDSQSCISYGCAQSATRYANGGTNSMPYHTGTMAANRSNYTAHMQYRNIEGLWANVYDWLDGCYISQNKLYTILNPEYFSDSATEHGTLVCDISALVTYPAYPTEFKIYSECDFPIFFPSASGGSDSTYMCDSAAFPDNSPCLTFGGGYNSGKDRGLFYLYPFGTNIYNKSIGTRLIELPDPA